MPRPTKADERTREDKRRIVRRALVDRELVSHIARDEGLSRQTVGDYIQDAEKDPEGAVEEAREELAFREEMAEMLGY